VFAGAREAIALFNLETLRCVEANDAFVTIYGWTKQELREVTLRQLGNPGDAEKAARECLAQGSLRLSAPLNLRADRSAFPAECDVHLLLLGERRVLCLISHDLTAQRRLQESLLLADRFAAVGTLAAGVSHEINNPLAYVLANLTFVAERLPELRGGAGVEQSISELQPALREAINGAQRVREIVRDLSTFSRPELPDGMPLELNPLLESVLRLVQAEVKLRATLVREIAPLPLPLVIGHEQRFAQVMLNLLNNALEALEALPGRGPAQNLLRVAAHTANDEVIIEIEDNGPGLTDEQQRRAFDPFFTTRSVGHGTGLGLSVCHGIVTAMGGRIELKSAVSRGTTVRVLLPIAPSGRPVEKVRPTSDPGRISMLTLPRMMVIDDEPMLTDAIRRMLLGEAVVTPLTTVDQAIALLAAGEKYDAILCDLHLTGKSGMDFHHELTRSMPAVAARLGFITGGAIDEASQAFVRKHSDRVLEKPFSRNGLRALVKSLVVAP
jgi:signal transduction histidine kinase